MARSIGFVALAVLAMSFTVSASRRAVLSEAGGAQYDLGDVQGMHRQLMSSLKQAQEAAGIFVEDAHLFEGALNNGGRRLQQDEVDPSAVLSNPSIFAGLLSLISQGMSVGAFPGAALSLPGGSPFGYAPTDDSYCLFATTPYTGPSAAPAIIPGSPLPSEGIPDTFGCVAASSNPPPSPNSFPVNFQGQAFVCSGSVATPPAGGRRLQQATGPVDVAIGNALTAAATVAPGVPPSPLPVQIPPLGPLNFPPPPPGSPTIIGLPIWNCVVSTTPQGETTLGQATLAVLNDVGVVAEHLLVYLNANGQLTYEEDIKNDFVSLTNPLYPQGPRLNFSIDFASVTKDKELFKEIFGKPAPPSPNAAPTTPSSPPSGPASPPTPPGPDSPPATPSGGDGGETSGGEGSASTTEGGASTTEGTTDTPAAPAETTLTAFDGYIDNCQAVFGSVPHADGNFDRNNNFSTVIVDGAVQIPLSTIDSFAGNVAYVIPASKTSAYEPLTAATKKSAQFCYDIASLQPVYNPLATYLTSGATAISANPLTTVASFGNAYGLTPDALVTALVVTLPAGESLWSYDALADAAKGSAGGVSTLKSNVEVANLVTSGANLLTNDTTVYASYAIIMNQAIAKKVVYSPPTGGRKLLQAPAVDLTNATTVASIMTLAAQAAPSQPDEATRAALSQDLSGEQILAVSQAVANLNTITQACTDAECVMKSQYYSETQLAPSISDLSAGDITVADFTAATSPSAITESLAKTTLPGSLVPQTEAVATTPPPAVTSTQTQASESGSSSSSGLSHGGKVALATVLPIVGVIAIVAAVAFFMSRKNSNGGGEGNDVWWRRPFGGASQSAAPATV